jgi:hypothetical protein
VNPVVAFTVNNRPAYLRVTLASWARARGVAAADLIFRCEPGCDEAAELSRATASWSHSTFTYINEARRGVLANPWHALEDGFATGAGFVVLAEEDTPVSTDILEFFTWAANTYRDDEDVTAVCAHQLDAPPGEPGHVYRTSHFSPIVWGTWFDRWDRQLRDSWDFDYSHKGWDWRINNLLERSGQVAISPVLARAQHIGEHGGTHCTPDFFPNTVAKSFRGHFERQRYREIRSV